jgi:t-SNARE complex subunit (syntaxin)
MFIIGFEEGQEMIKELSDLIFDMEKELKRQNELIQKLKKGAKNAKEV